jgi:hypothetical protein
MEAGRAGNGLGEVQGLIAMNSRAFAYVAMAAFLGSISLPVRANAQGMGVWSNVTPPGIDLGTTLKNDNYGVQDVVVDPVRPMDAYAFTCHQGLWKSTDYGATWTGPINTGAGGSALDGKQWTAVIDNNPHRNPATPPTLWTSNGNNALGVLKSKDGGVTWTHYATHNLTAGPANTYGGEDTYALDSDPYDNRHMLTGFHSLGLSESFDGGETWHDITVPADFGGSVYPFFIDTGDSATTRGTWFAESDQDTTGSWSTTNSGAAWTRIGRWGHPHGSAQMFNAGRGVAYAGGNKGVFKTVNGGVTWTNVYAKGNGVIGTPSTLYTSFSFPGGPGTTYDPALSKAPRNPGTAWDLMPKPAGITNGSKRASVTFDGTHYVILAGCWNAGIWRYMEDAGTDIRIRPIRHSSGTGYARQAGIYDFSGRCLGMAGIGMRGSMDLAKLKLSAGPVIVRAGD